MLAWHIAYHLARQTIKKKKIHIKLNKLNLKIFLDKTGKKRTTNREGKIKIKEKNKSPPRLKNLRLSKNIWLISWLNWNRTIKIRTSEDNKNRIHRKQEKHRKKLTYQINLTTMFDPQLKNRKWSVSSLWN